MTTEILDDQNLEVRERSAPDRARSSSDVPVFLSSYDSVSGCGLATIKKYFSLQHFWFDNRIIKPEMTYFNAISIRSPSQYR